MGPNRIAPLLCHIKIILGRAEQFDFNKSEFRSKTRISAFSPAKYSENICEHFTPSSWFSFTVPEKIVPVLLCVTRQPSTRALYGTSVPHRYSLSPSAFCTSDWAASRSPIPLCHIFEKGQLAVYLGFSKFLVTVTTLL